MTLLTSLEQIVGKRIVSVKQYDNLTRLACDDNTHILLDAVTTSYDGDAEIRVAQDAPTYNASLLHLGMIDEAECDRRCDVVREGE